MVGAIATVALGVMVLHRYYRHRHAPGSPAPQTPLRRRCPTSSSSRRVVGLRDADKNWARSACAPKLETARPIPAHLVRLFCHRTARRGIVTPRRYSPSGTCTTDLDVPAAMVR